MEVCHHTLIITGIAQGTQDTNLGGRVSKEVLLGKITSAVHVLILAMSRVGVDAYSVLALLSFLVFLFYVIFNFLTNGGNGKRSFRTLNNASSKVRDILKDTTKKVMEALDKFEN